MRTPHVTSRRRSIWKRFAFGALLLAIFAGVIGGLAIWYIRANTVTATALFHVPPQTTILADETSQRFDAPAHERLKKSQSALIKSHFLLMAAMRAPSIAALAPFAGVDDPEGWLADHLHVEYPEDGDYLAISLSGPASQSDDLVLILDAVVKAYQDEVLYKEKGRQMAQRDLISVKLEAVDKEISKKVANVIEFAQSKDSRDNNVLNQPGVIRLDEIDPNTVNPDRTASDPQTKTDAERFEVEKQHIERFREQLDKAEKTFMTPSEKIVALNARNREIVVLEKIAVELSEKLKRLDLNADSPPQIELVQPATIEE